MKRNELVIVASLAVIGLVVGFWLVVISPKRDEAATLKGEVDQLRSSLEQTQQATAAGEAARKSFPVDYRRLVVLGKAVPEDGEQASLLVQLQALADRSGVRFQSIDLSQSTGSAPPSASSSSTSTSTESAAAPASSTSTDSASSSSASSASSTPASPSSSPAPEATAVATEASAASLPIGASVGPAGLPVMPYELTFTGDYFQIAGFMKRVDGLVHMRRGLVAVRGRLLTVDAFSLEPVQSETANVGPVPTLAVNLTVTSYLTPADQGTTAGATPTAPAPAAATPAASTPSSSTPAPTSSAGPVPGAAGPTTTSP